MQTIRSIYMPTGSTRVLEAQLQSPFMDGDTLLFEPDGTEKMDGLEMPEAVVTQCCDGKILILVENHAALAVPVEPGACV